eukprot:3937249-Rhodomonas_salina.1
MAAPLDMPPKVANLAHARRVPARTSADQGEGEGRKRERKGGREVCVWREGGSMRAGRSQSSRRTHPERERVRERERDA